MQANSASRLKHLLAREISSLLHYLSGAWPWTSTQERAAVQTMERLIADERAAHLKLVAALRRARLTPPGARYSMDFSHLHYVGLDHLLPMLVEEQKDMVAKAEADLAAVAADPDAERLFRPFVELKRAHLAKIEHLAQEHTGAKAASTVR